MLKKLVRNIVYPIIKSSPDFLVIGAQKAGTTSLYNYLVQHPQIIKNNTFKEVQYFSNIENYERGYGWYLGQFPHKLKKGNKLTLDASPQYLSDSRVPLLIKKQLGNIKMIVILRNPADRAYSAWKMYHSFGYHANVTENNKKIADYRTFSEAIEQELTNQCSTTLYPYEYINRGKYFEHLTNYYNYFDKEKILILNFDNFKKRLDFTLKVVCEFLDIETFSEVQLKVFSEKKYNEGIEKNITEVDEQTLQRLSDYFQPFNHKLYELLGESFDWQTQL